LSWTAWDNVNVIWDSGNAHTGDKPRKRKQTLTYKLGKRIERAVADKTEKGLNRKVMSGRKKENKIPVEFQIS
jgi:hypothetical protein